MTPWSPDQRVGVIKPYKLTFLISGYRAKRVKKVKGQGCRTRKLVTWIAISDQYNHVYLKVTIKARRTKKIGHQ